MPRAFEQVRPGPGGTPQQHSSYFPSRRGKRFWLLVSTATALMLLGAAIFLTPAPVSEALDSIQVTISAEPKTGPPLTDGSRLYLTSRGRPSQMAVGGGPMVPMNIFEPGTRMWDISADVSKVLATKSAANDEVGRGTLWTASMLGGTPRKLSDHLALAARWFVDGRSILFSDRSTLYRIGANGENLRKIWSGPTDLSDLEISPDGTALTVTAGDNGDVTRLWSVSASGKNAHALLPGWPEKSNQYSGQWTPDGRHFCSCQTAKTGETYTNWLRPVGSNSGRRHRR